MRSATLIFVFNLVYAAPIRPIINGIAKLIQGIYESQNAIGLRTMEYLLAILLKEFIVLLIS